MNLAEIRKLVKLVENSGIDELEIEEENTRVRVVKNGFPGTGSQQYISVPNMPPQANVQLPPVTGDTGTSASVVSKPAVSETALHVNSPMVGTYYSAPSPEAPPYVQVGDHVKPGQALCIIEAMKLMNEIEAEVSGTITKIHVENAEPVEFGAPLFSIEPD